MPITDIIQGPMTVSTSTSVAPTFLNPTQAQNALICVVVSNGSGISLSTGTGWILAVASGTHPTAIYYKPNCGAGESPPTFADSGASFMAAQLSEVAGIVLTSPIDQTNSNASLTTNPWTMTNSAADTAVDFVVLAAVATGTKSATWNISESWAPSGGSVFSTNSGATKNANVCLSSLYEPVSNSSADADTVTFLPSTGAWATSGACIASFKIRPNAAPAAPTGVAASQAASGQPVTVTWTDETTGFPASTYNILRSTDNVSFSQIASGIAHGTQTYSDTSALSAITYYYEVQATNASGTATSTSVSVAVKDVYRVATVVGQAVNRAAVF